MIFGDPQLFAIEAVLDKADAAKGSLPNTQVAGRIRVIMSGCTIGNFDEPHCWFGPPSNEMSNLPFDSLWHPFFDDLDYGDVFDVLNLVTFGADREGCIDEHLCDGMMSELPFTSDDIEINSFLMNSSEAFDGWKCFLLRPPGNDLVALSIKWPSKEIDVSRFPVILFQNTVNEFSRWIMEQ